MEDVELRVNVECISELFRVPERIKQAMMFYTLLHLECWKCVLRVQVHG